MVEAVCGDILCRECWANFIDFKVRLGSTEIILYSDVIDERSYDRKELAMPIRQLQEGATVRIS